MNKSGDTNLSESQRILGIGITVWEFKGDCRERERGSGRTDLGKSISDQGVPPVCRTCRCRVPSQRWAPVMPSPS